MNFKGYLIIAFLILSYCVFSQKVFTDDQLKFEFPKKEKTYKLEKQSFILKDSSIISTIYVRMTEETRVENYEVTETIQSYNFIRFFPNGKVFFSFAYKSYPTREEFNDLTYGKYGCYTLKDNDLIVELYMNRQYGIMFMFAKVHSNGIQFSAYSHHLKSIFKSKTKDGGFYKRDSSFKP